MPMAPASNALAFRYYRKMQVDFYSIFTFLGSIPYKLESEIPNAKNQNSKSLNSKTPATKQLKTKISNAKTPNSNIKLNPVFRPGYSIS